jgi:hypothetical protein
MMIFSVSKLKGRMDKSCCQFEEKWQIIICGGALDGKHFRIMHPPGSGAQYYNYKNFYSIILMALFPGGKARPGRDADHSPPSSAEIKNEQELYLLSPNAPPWHVAGHIYLYLDGTCERQL